MPETPSRAIRLFGTEQPAPSMRILRAGPLSAELEDGNLRYIRLNGVEMMRAISFVARDPVWGTYQPEIVDLAIEESDQAFRVSYGATVRDARQSFRYEAVIEGRADGFLRFAAKGTAETDFATNRTGFVVLHPVDGVAGAPATVENVDGNVREARFPDEIDPYQPMMDLRAVTHAIADGTRVTCRMTGDTYEMEDQRNWTDASFKTYVRPISLPWPYTLAAGTAIEQSVTLSVEGPTPRPRQRSDSVTLRIGDLAGTVPPLGIGIDPVDLDATRAEVEPLRTVAPAIALFRHDAGRGGDLAQLADAAALARTLGAEARLQLVVRDLDDFVGELDAVGEAAAALGSPFRTVYVSPAPDLFGTLPGSPWPACPPLEDVYAAARKAFPGVALGGGMFAYFTELNRKRPPLEGIDAVTFLTTAINHSCDDRSVAETLECLPYIAKTARSIAGGKPYAVGPSGIGVRDNPYNEERLVVTDNARVSTGFNDPRQRGLFAAAWNLGYFARFAEGGAESITLGGGVGAFGLLHSPQAWPQPWFDEEGGLFPTFHVLRGLAALNAGVRRAVSVSDERAVLALAVDRQRGGREIWIANLEDVPHKVRIEPTPGNAAAYVLDADGFVAATKNPDFLLRTPRPLADSTLELDSYAVARIVDA